MVRSSDTIEICALAELFWSLLLFYWPSLWRWEGVDYHIRHLGPAIFSVHREAVLYAKGKANFQDLQVHV